MHVTKPYENSIHLFKRGCGKVYTFKNLTDAAKHLGWIQSLGTIGEQFESFIYDWALNRRIPTHYDFVLRNDDGEVITEGELCSEYRRVKRKKYRDWRGYPNQRQPGAKRGGFRMFRRMKTFQEVKWANAWDEHNEEIPVKGRARRNRHNLPNSWDDYIRRDKEHRSWKRHRKTQWKSK